MKECPLCVSIYTKFKTRQNESMMLEVKTTVPFREQLQGIRGEFQGCR